MGFCVFFLCFGVFVFLCFDGLRSWYLNKVSPFSDAKSEALQNTKTPKHKFNLKIRRNQQIKAGAAQLEAFAEVGIRERTFVGVHPVSQA